MGELTFLPIIPTAVWTALAVAAAVLLVIYATRRPRSIGRARWAVIVVLMTAAVSLPLVVLLNPTWMQRTDPPGGKPLLTVLLDVSLSMNVDDTESGTRFENARQVASAAASELDQEFDVRLMTFDRGTALTDAQALRDRQPDGMATDLARAIVEGLANDRPGGQALLVLSDGIHNTGGSREMLDALASARALGAPIFVQAFGGHRDVRDLRVEFQSPQEIAFIGQNVTAGVRLEQTGLPGRTATVRLVRDGEELASQQVTLSRAAVELSFPLEADQAGLFRYECRVDPVPGEVSTVNNADTLLLRVVDQPVRVLLLEGKPYWDTKFLVRTLSRDASIELESFVQMAPGRYLHRSLSQVETADPPATASPEEPDSPTQADDEVRRRQTWEVVDRPTVLTDAGGLDDYQIVILGRDVEAMLVPVALENLQRWVDRGGSLVCSRGPPASEINERLGRLLPVRWAEARETRFRVDWTSQGSRLRWLAGLGSQLTEGIDQDLLPLMPSLATSARVDADKILTTVLAAASSDERGAQQAVISYQPFGAGRTVVVEGAGMWRWAFLSPDFQAHEQVYHALWQNLVRWLVSQAGLLPGQQLALRTDRVSFSEDDAASASLLLADTSAEPPEVALTGGELAGQRSFVPVAAGDEPGTFRIVFGKLPEGRYEARVTGPLSEDPAASTVFDVRRNLQEELDLTARPDLLAALARETGGDVLTGAPLPRLAERFDQHRRRHQPDRVERTTAWDRWWVLAGIFGLWTASWIVRRQQGLV